MINLSWVKNKPEQHLVANNIDYYQLYEFIANQSECSYLLDSLTASSRKSKYFTIGFNPYVIFSATGNNLSVSGPPKNLERLIGVDSSVHTIKDVNPYLYLQKNLNLNWNVNEFQGGLVGYFSYESMNYFEPAIDLKEHKDFANFQLGLYLDGMIFDSQTKNLYYYYFGESNLDEIKHLIKLFQSHQEDTQTKLDIKKLPDSSDQLRYFKSMDYILEQIKNGNTYQCEAGYKTKFKIKGDKLKIYRRLREINPSPYMFHVKFGNRELLGASPEVLVSSTAGKVSTTPTAGTIKTGRTEKENARLINKLLNDPKETAEHNMLVDLHRNDISDVCEPGSVKVLKYKDIIKFSHVQHIVSDIQGRLRQNKDSFDVLAGILPGGVVTGVPKIETMKIISKCEKDPRGPYGGAVGRFSLNGDSVFCLPIRSLFCSGDNCFTQTSSGVVYDSVPFKEFQEVADKLEAMEETIKSVSGPEYER